MNAPFIQLLFLMEAATAVLLLFFPPPGIRPSSLWFGAALLGVIWL